MPKFTMYQFDPLPQPDPPDPADQTQFQKFVAAELPGVEGQLDGAGSRLAAVLVATNGAESEVEDIGRALAAAADILSSYGNEEDPITLVDEVAAALGLDNWFNGL